MRGTWSGRGVLFDVDGTLVDSNYLHTMAWSRALRRFGYEIDMYRIHRSIGMGSDQLLQHLVGRPDERLSEAHSEEMKAFQADVRAFAGAADLMRQLHREGATLAWATSAKPDEIDRLLGVVGAREAVSHVIGSQDVQRSKPAPDLFQVALESAGLDRGKTFAVGDSKWDGEAAKRTGIAFVGVLTGGTSREELNESGAAAVYVDVNEILASVRSGELPQLIESQAG